VNHVFCVAVLHDAAVDYGSNAEVSRIAERIQSNEARAERSEAVKAFAADPLGPALFQLPVARTDIVAAGETGYVIERAVSRDIAIQNLDRESRMLRDIRNTLQRIDQDTFGNCLHCEQEISRRRLEAVPWAQLCLRCQEAADRGDETVIDTVRTWLADAA